MRGRSFLVGAVLGLAASCLDPLYEDGTSAGWYVCCPRAVVDTCLCSPGEACLPSFTPCAGGACSAGPSCLSGFQDAGMPGTGGGSGGGTGGGTGGSTGTGGGTGADAGMPGDAGAPVDAGPGVDAGTPADAGPPPDAGAPRPDVYEVCCVEGRVSTCRCDNAGCARAPYTVCPRGACVAGTAKGSCP